MMLKSNTDMTKLKQTLEDFHSIIPCKILLVDKRSDVYDQLQTAAGLNIWYESPKELAIRIINMEICSIKLYWKNLLWHKRGT